MSPTRRWSHYVDACRSCGGSDAPHFGRGYCKRCYRRLHHLGALGPPLPRRWSIWSDFCLTCGCDDRPHDSQGVCHTCRQATYRFSPKGRETVARYIASEHGRAVRRECTQRYARSERGLDVTRHNTRHQREKQAGVSVDVPVGYDHVVLDAFGDRCTACGADDGLELDHHRPLEAGYPLLHNAVPLCRGCNARKGSRDPVAFYGAWRAAEIAVALSELRDRLEGSIVVLTVVKRSEDDLADWLATEAGFIGGLCSYDGEPIVLEPFQIAFLNNQSRFRWVTKSRQVGYSFLLSLEALARCHLRDGHTTVFVSYNLEDAKEKILVARQVFEELPLAFQKKLIVDSKTELAFESTGAHRRLSRILSVPSKAPRGKRGDILLDELAHLVNDREVYRGSTALILRSNGQLTGCSTPLGRRGIFWEVAREEIRKYPHHTRQEVPWWLSRFFCTDPSRAAIEAPTMETDERVERFGRAAIVEQFESLDLDDFQQELECRFVDESYSWFPYDLILPNTTDDLVLADDFTDVPTPQGRIVAGFDVGRTRDRSELAVFEEVDGRFTCRLLRTYAEAPFAEQEADLRRLFEVLPVARLSIDRSGIGMNLAENLARDFPQVVAENFTNEAKERWATDFKILLQRREVVLPRNRELVAQVHSIKKRVLGSGKVAFDAERTARGGHADRFWAIALACQKQRGPGRGGGATEIGVRVLG